MASIKDHGENFKLNGVNIPLSGVNKDMLLSCVDIISEGPIEGPPKGAASIYMDDTPAATLKQAGNFLSNTAAEFTLTSGSTAVSVANLQENLTPWTAGEAAGDKYLVVKGLASAQNISAVEVEPTEDKPVRFDLTAAADFFYSYMLYDSTGTPSNQAYITLKYTVGDQTVKLYARITSITSTTVARCEPTGITRPLGWQDSSSGQYKIFVHVPLKLASISTTSLVLDSSTNVASGTFSGNISHSIHSPDFTADNVIPDVVQVDGFDYQFRHGTLQQRPVDDIYTGSGALSISSELNVPLAPNNDGETWPSVAGATQYTRESSQFNLSSATARQVDMIKLVFSYPGGLWSHGEKNKYDGIVAYKIEIAIDKGDGFGTFDNVNPNDEFTYHVDYSKSAFFIQEDISLESYKPFIDFKMRFTRASRDDIGPKNDRNYDLDNTVGLASTITTATCILRERLNYPYTAFAQVRCTASQFNNIPKRSYECKGRLVQVPSNYVTRDESLNGVANYRRISSTGGIHGSEDQDWDGSFRAGIVYTDNPAWVFYDIVTNDRYGLGTWIDTTDIDKYALYRIARYCDELVPDGTGGTEPRFVANIYLTKATEAYKVLKDMATTFRAFLFWSEGNIVPVVDLARDPIYNFTKGNVIDGRFEYESTGSKLRSNQVAVTWNNPANDYVPEVLLVEDRENIVKTGKIIIEEAVAFGATSIGQATRYGRWKLWTAINQSEVVSFKTAISSAFITPGDIINVQDADRYDVAYSGRIKTTGTLDAGEIPLDREIILNVGSDYYLSVLIQEPAALLGQDSATILVGSTNTSYVRGDVLDSTLYTDETDASNIQDTSDNVVQVVWAPYTHVESQKVTGATGSRSSLTVETDFTTSPDREAIWLLREEVISSKLEREGSKKMYKILEISEADKTTFSISAVENCNAKFDDVDVDFGNPYVDTMLEPGIDVPPPTNLVVSRL